MAEIKATLVFDADKNSFKLVEKESAKAGEKSGDKFQKGFKKELNSGIKESFKSLRTAAITAGAALAAVFTKRVVDAAIAQEDAVNRLNASLRRIGEFSETASQDIQSFASQLQQQTRFGDEVILQNIALAQSFGATAKQSKELVQAALDLAAAQGTDLNAAVRQISKTLGGYAGELGEVLPQLKTLTQEQLRNGEVIGLIRKEYAGFAEREAATFGAALQRLSNNFGDALEELGFFITKSETGKELIKELSDGFRDAVIGIKNFRLALAEVNKENVAEKIAATKDSIADLESQIKDLNKETQESLTGRLGSESQTASSRVSVLTSRVSELKKELSDLQKFAKDSGIKDVGKDAGESAKALALNAEQLGARLKSIGIIDPEAVRSQLDKEFEIVKIARNRRLITEEEFQTRLKDIRNRFEQETSNPSFESGFDALAEGFTKIDDKALNFNKTLSEVGKNIRTQIATSLAGTITSIGKALVTGENAFENFGQGILKLFADIAVQLGAFFVALGTGYLFSGIPKFEAVAPQLIAAGAALSLLGGVLQGFSSSGSGEGAAGTSDVSGGGVATDSPEIARSIDQQEAKQSVTINVQGDVLDSRESSLRILELFNQATSEEGGVVLT